MAQFRQLHQAWGRKAGQGIIEYAGAMITAALIVGSLVMGMGTNNWMYEAYNSIITAAGDMLTEQASNL